MESVLVALFTGIFGIKDSEVRSSSLQGTVNIFMNSETFSQHDEGSTEKSMSFEDFRSWCTHLPSVRKLLGNLLMPPDSGILRLMIHFFFFFFFFFPVCYHVNDVTREYSYEIRWQFGAFDFV